MALSKIYTCKLYRASKHKHKIQSAIDDPRNKELVQQLSRYLDDEYKEDAAAAKSEKTQQTVQKLKSTEPDTNSTEPLNHSAPPRPSSVSHNLGGDDSLVDDMSKVDDKLNPESEGSTSDDAVSESTNLNNKSSVLANQSIDSKVMVDVVKGTLDSREDTCGVNRVIQKDNELWVYYEDKINLNSVMGPAIELISNSGCKFLEFNRLARSDNAIVFDINLNTSSGGNTNGKEK